MERKNSFIRSDKLIWFPINEHTAKLTFDYQGISLFYFVTFNTIGEITQMETKRYINKDKMETWIGKFGNYQKINGVIIPKSVEAIWKLEKGEISYAKFRVTNIFYDQPNASMAVYGYRNGKPHYIP